MLEGMNETLSRIRAIEANFTPSKSADPAAEPGKTGSFSDLFAEASAKTGIDSRLLKAVAKAESSGAGAVRMRTWYTVLVSVNQAGLPLRASRMDKAEAS